MKRIIHSVQHAFRIAFVTIVTIAMCANLGFAQCGTPAFKANAGWCDNYYAKWEINGTIPAGTKYHWYYDDGTSLVDVGYGPNGNGSVMTTPYRCSADDGNTVTMMYSKEGEAIKINPSLGKNFNYINNSETNSEFYSDLSFPFDVHLSSFTIPTKTWANGDITVTTTIRGTTTYTVSTIVNSSELAGGFLTIMVDKDIKKGDYSVTVKIGESNGQLGWSDNTLSALTDAFGTVITPGVKAIWGGNKYSMLYDINYTFKCDLKESPVSNLRTTNCCDPVYGNDVWISASSEYLEAGESTTLTVTQYNDKDNNYFVWYKDGTQIKAVKGLIEYTTNSTGVYSVRETKSTSAQYLNEPSCYSEGIIDIQKKMFQVVNNDEAPSYCYGSKIELQAVPNSGVSLSNVSWTPATLFANPKGKTAVATLSADGNITFEATATIYDGSKIINGDFEAGKTGFSSDYNIKTDGSIPDGQNALISDKGTTGYIGSVNYKGKEWKNNVAYWTKDNTPTGTQCTGDGKFLLIDGKSGQRGYTVWEETVTVTTNQDYEFAMDMANIGWGDLSKDPIEMGASVPLEVYVNDVLILSASPNNEWCVWETATAKWNSGSATTADIKIVQQCPSDNGYDFTLDNVNFGIPRKQKDRVTIPVTDCYEVEIENNSCVLTAKAVNSSTGEVVGQVDHWEDETGTIVGYGSTLDVSEIGDKATYKAVAYFPAGSVISNGDFEFGVSGFKYGNANSLYDEGNQVGSFRILKGEDIVPNTACGQWCVRVDDHTSGSGNMLFVDPKSEDGDVIGYDFEAIKDKAYILSLYFANACRFTDRNPLPFSAQLSFIVKNNKTGALEEIVTKQLSDNNDWEDLSAVWTAPSDGSYTLYIRAAGDNTLSAFYGTGTNQRSGGNDFVIDDISFATSLDKVYEAEIEVSPCIACTEPTAVTLTPSTRTDGYMCDGETITLTTNNQVDATTFQFDWYKGETIETGSPVTNKVAVTNKKSDSYSISDIADADTYWVRVSDAKYPTMESCWKEQSFTITPAEKPTVKVTGGDTYCAGATIKAPVFTFTGTPPFKFKYTDGFKESNWITGYTSMTYSPTTLPSDPETYKYKLTALEDAHCVADDLSSFTDIMIIPQPKIVSMVSSGNDCEGNLLSVTLTTSNAVGASYFINGPKSYSDYGPVETSNTTIHTVSSSATIDNSGEYTVRVELAMCTDEKKIDVSIYPQPKISAITPDHNKVCSGDDITFSATITNKGSGTPSYSWTGTTTSSNETAVVRQTVTTETTVTEKLTYSETYSDKTCSVTSTEASAVINPLPTPVITRSKPSVCVGIEDVTLGLTESYSSQTWTCSPTNVISNTTIAAPIISKNSKTDTYTIGVSVTDANGCSASAESTTVTINSNLTPEIKAEPESFCKNATTVLSLPSQSYKKITWSEGSTTLGTDETVTYGSGKADGSYTVAVAVEDENGCTGTSTQKITIHPLPTATLTPETEIKMCDLTTETIKAIITGGEDGKGPYTAVGTWSSNATKVGDFEATYTANGAGQKTVEYNYKSTYGCEFDSPIPSKKINVIEIPAPVADWTVTYCQDATASALQAPSSASGVKWYDSETSTTALSAAPTPSTATAGTQYYYVTQQPDICESAKAKITVVTNPLPEPVITAKVGGVEKDNACYGTAISLSLDQSYSKGQVWSCDPSGNLSSTTDAAPLLKATAPVGDYVVGVVVTDANNCSNKTPVTIPLTIHPIPTATLSTLTAKCADDETAQTITATISDDLDGDGVWTGNVKKVSEKTASFVPKTAGAGTNSISYEFTSLAGCKAEKKLTSVEVFSMPEITITPSLTEVCEQGGTTSGDITMALGGTYATTGAQTPTYSYTSSTLTGVDATTGTFSSIGQVAGTHTVNLTYTDANGCKGLASNSVKINAKPIIDFDLQTTICDYESAINLVGKVKYESGSFSTISGGTVAFSGTGGVSGSAFTPTGLAGEKEITLSYTDANGCKADDVKHSIVVNHIDVPDAVSASASKLDVSSQTDVPKLMASGATGASFKWYASNDATTTVLSENEWYQIPFVNDGSGKMTEGQYFAYYTQTLNGCESEPAEAILTITDCKVTSPTAPKFYACAGQNGIEVHASSTYANPESDATKTIGWFWNSTQIPVTTVSSLNDANPDGKGLTFTVPQDKVSAAGTITVYVSEYDGTSGTECFSPATAVTVEVHAKPEPTIIVPDVICSTENTIDVTYGPATSGNVTSTLTAASGDITDNKTWSLVFDENTTSVTKTELTVSTDEVWGAGTTEETTCTNSITKEFSVTNVIAPTGTGIGTPQVWSSSEEKIALVPNMIIDYATDLSATLSVKNSSSVEIGTSSPIDMKPNITAEGSYTYSVQQWVNTCPSPIATSVWNIVECPTPVPTAESQSLCAKTDDLQAAVLPTLVAENEGDGTTEWLWYSDEDGTNQVGSGKNLNVNSISGYTSSVTEETVYTFYVKQNGNDGTGGTDMCFGPLSEPITITVHPNPEVVVKPFDNSVLCYYDGTKTAKATVDGKDLAELTNGHGVWSILSETSGIDAATGELDLQFNGEEDGAYTIQYEYYTDYPDGNSCYGKSTLPIEIEFAETPTTTEIKRLTITEEALVVTAGNVATTSGTVVNWYNNDVLLANDNPWTVPSSILDQTKESTTTYLVSQTIRGCESETTEQIISIKACPFTAPIVENIQTCSEVPFESFEANVPAGVSANSWAWYNADGSKISNSTNEFTPSVIETANFSVSYFANEPYTGIECESKKTDIQAKVLPLPEITFNGNPSMLCYDLGTRQLNVQVDYHTNGAGSGVWAMVDNSFAGAVSSTGEFVTNFRNPANESVSEKPSYKLQYSYTDMSGCSKTETMDIAVRYVSKPVLSHHYTMSSQNIDAELSATLDAGDSTRWYAGEMDLRVAATVVTANGKNSWKTGDLGNVIVEKTYYASQVVDGCESQRAATTVSIVPCPIPAPKTIGNEICNYDETKELTAVESSWAERPNGKAEKFYLYNADKEKIDENETGIFVPAIDKSEANVFTFYISEYNSQPIAELTVPAGCESPMEKVSLKVKKTASASIVASQEQVCEYPEGTNPEMRATGYEGTGMYYWYEEDPNYPNCTPSDNMGARYTPVAPEVGTHPVWVEVLEDGCYSEPTMKEFVIKPIPMKPEVLADSVCEGEANKAVTAISENGFITWYADASRTKARMLKTNSATYVSPETTTGRYSYFATQTVDGCQSPVAEVQYRIIGLPSAPEIVTNEYHYCEYDNPPALKAVSDSVGAKIRWYLSDKKTYANTETTDGFGEVYQLESLIPGRNILYATQTFEGCEGSLAPLAFYVYAKPSSPVVNDAVMCEGSKDIPTLSTNLSLDKWYSDSLATQYMMSGYTYTPDSSIVKRDDLTYYIVREQNKCFSDTVPITLHIFRTPTIDLGEDTSFCIYDTLPSVVASVTPALCDGSMFTWYVSPNALSKPVVAMDTFNIEEYKNTLSGKTIEYIVRAQYAVKVSDLLTCKSAFDTVRYVVNERGRKPVVFSEVICEGEEIDPLRALGTPNITWVSLDGILPEVWHGQKYEFARGQELPVGMYRFMVCDEDMATGCKSEFDTLEMTVAASAKTKIIGEDSTCVKETLSYYSMFTEGSNYYWSVTNDVLNYSKENMSSSVRYFDFNEQGIDTITLYERTWAGCEGFDTLVVTVAPNPTALFKWTLPGASNVVELLDSSVQDTLWKVNDLGELEGTPIPYTLYWNYGHSGESEDQIDTVVAYERRKFPLIEANYMYGYNCPSLTIENSFGCRNKYSECLFVNIATSLYMPTAFAPANPAHSVRTFQPKGFNLRTCEVSVFDKWGNLLWFSNDVEDGKFIGYWDGMYDGKMMQAGEYIWKMEATFLDGQIWEGFDAGNGKKTKFGSVMLIR